MGQKTRMYVYTFQTHHSGCVGRRLCQFQIFLPVFIGNNAAGLTNGIRRGVVFAHRGKHAGHNTDPRFGQDLLHPVPGARVIPMRGKAHLHLLEPEGVDLFRQIKRSGSLKGPTAHTNLLFGLYFHSCSSPLPAIPSDTCRT